MLALVTGGGGFLGQYIVEQLRRPRRSRAQPGSRALSGACERWASNACGPTCATPRPCARPARGVDVVFHTAAVAGIWGPWEHYLRHQRARHAARDRRLPRSTACRGWSTRAAPASRSTARRRRASTNGAAIRRAGCATIRTPRRWPSRRCWRPTAATLATCALRPHLIWGPRDQHLIPRLIARARAGNCDAWATART